MNKKLLTACAAILLVGFASTSFANQISLVNTSQQAKLLTIEYKIAYKNRGQATVFGPSRTLKLINSAMITIDLRGYEYAGIMPVAVEGHILPASANEFAKPQHCALATDKTHAVGTLKFNYSQLAHQRGEISCSLNGGVYTD
jgi:hypothetical protein